MEGTPDAVTKPHGAKRSGCAGPNTLVARRQPVKPAAEMKCNPSPAGQDGQGGVGQPDTVPPLLRLSSRSFVEVGV